MQTYIFFVYFYTNLNKIYLKNKFAVNDIVFLSHSNYLKTIIMPLFLSENINVKAALGIWKIEETDSYFINNIKFNDNELLYLKSLQNQSRKLQWLSVRMLLKEFQQKYDIHGHIIYNKDGSPYLSTGKNISISHTVEYSCLIYGDNIKAGIDIEKISERIKKIKKRMASGTELKFAHDNIEQLITLWTAKEAIFKLCRCPELNFVNDIFVDLASINNDCFFAQVKHKSIDKKFLLKKMCINNHILVYAFDN